MNSNFSPSAPGMLAILFALVMWTGLVAYYAFFPNLTPTAIVAYRIVWSFVLVCILISCLRQWHVIREIARNKKNLILLTLCGIFLGLNWLAFVVAIKVGKAMEASLGSYLNPMLGVASAVFVFREHVSFLKKASMCIAFIGVGYLIIAHGTVPWYALALSIPFMFYAIVHKYLTLNVLNGFFFEMLILMPFAVSYLLLSPDIVLFIDESVKMQIMIIMLGPISCLSLIAFAYGIQKLSFSTVNVIQYLYPTMTFILSITYFNEPIGNRMIPFIFIWLGVLIYLIDTLMHARQKKQNSVTVLRRSL